eukprot:GHVN01011544.1.p1 GENE.GHVN01011544.1~~GHVN01011544.1.p1  ORF type:complete len:1024 (+),score=242.88 GHVN01011544.1:222-3074(+)
MSPVPHTPHTGHSRQPAVSEPRKLSFNQPPSIHLPHSDSSPNSIHRSIRGELDSSSRLLQGDDLQWWEMSKRESSSGKHNEVRVLSEVDLIWGEIIEVPKEMRSLAAEIVTGTVSDSRERLTEPRGETVSSEQNEVSDANDDGEGGVGYLHPDLAKALNDEMMQSDAQVIGEWHFFDPITIVDRHFYCEYDEDVNSCHDAYSDHSLLISNEFASCRTISRVDELHFRVSVDSRCVSGQKDSPNCDKVDRDMKWALFEHCEDYWLVNAQCKYDCNVKDDVTGKNKWDTSETQSPRIVCDFIYDQDNFWGMRDEHIGMCYIQDGECLSSTLERHRVFCTGYDELSDDSLTVSGETVKRPEKDEKVILCPGLSLVDADTSLGSDDDQRICEFSAGDENKTAAPGCDVHYDMLREQTLNGCPQGKFRWGNYGAACYAGGFDDQPCFKYSDSALDIKMVHGPKSCAGEWNDWAPCQTHPLFGCYRHRDFTLTDVGLECQWKKRKQIEACEESDNSECKVNELDEVKQSDQISESYFKGGEMCVGTWLPWSPCTYLCIKRRRYKVLRQARPGGKECPFRNNDIQYEACVDADRQCTAPLAGGERDSLVRVVNSPMLEYEQRIKERFGMVCEGEWGPFSECDDFCRRYSNYTMRNITSTDSPQSQSSHPQQKTHNKPTQTNHSHDSRHIDHSATFPFPLSGPPSPHSPHSPILSRNQAPKCPDFPTHTAIIHCPMSECDQKAIKATIKLDGVSFELAKRKNAEFETRLLQQLSQLTGAPASQLTITSIRKGSIMVEVDILPAENGKDVGEVYDSLTQLQERAISLGSALGTVRIDQVTKMKGATSLGRQGNVEKEATKANKNWIVVVILISYVVMVAALLTIVLVLCYRKKKNRPGLASQEQLHHRVTTTSSTSSTGANVLGRTEVTDDKPVKEPECDIARQETGVEFTVWKAAENN